MCPVGAGDKPDWIADWTRGEREVAMDDSIRGPWRRVRGVDAGARAGVVSFLLIALTAVAWMAGWGAVAALSGLTAFAIVAAAAGEDSRMPGDWRDVGSG
jgi:hypothetical protein